MFKPILDNLDPIKEDSLNERINKEPIAKKYWITIGGSILLLALTAIISIMTMTIRKNGSPAKVIAVKVVNQQLDLNSAEAVPITLNRAHQSLKNVTSWVQDAVGETYSFGFGNFDEQIEKAQQYFTPKGYDTYLKALKANNIENDVKGKNLEVSIIPLQTPIIINGGNWGDTEFWRFRMPVLVSVSGGKTPVIENYMLELLVLRVPSHLNHKGLSIAEYNLKKG